MKILWVCGLPYEVQTEVLQGQDHGAYATWSWIMGHLPPPEDVELHIACRTAHHTTARQFTYKGAHFHLVPVKARARVYCLFEFDWRYFRALAAQINPEVVHGWGTEDAYALVALKLAPERHLVQIQGNLNTYRQRVAMPWPTPLAAWSERRVLSQARQVVAENEYSLAAARPMIRTDSAHVIEHPIRAEFLKATPTSGEARQILYVGAIDERKGIWDALEAFQQGAPPDWELVIVGNGSSEIVTKMRRLIEERDLAGRVRHHPQLSPSEIVTQMQAASVFLLPTRIDTGPTALKEALAMGLWPVGYDNSGPAYYVRRFQFGNLAEDLNVTALTGVLQQALTAKVWQEAGHREKIEMQIRPHFDPAHIWQELRQLYRTIGQGG